MTSLGEKLGFKEGGPGYPALELKNVGDFLYGILIDVERKPVKIFGKEELLMRTRADGTQFAATEWVATILVLATNGVHKEQEASQAHRAHIEALKKADKFEEIAAFKAANPIPTVNPQAGDIVRRFVDGPRERALRETFKSIGYHNVKLDGTWVFVEKYDHDTWKGYGNKPLEKAAHIHTYELRPAGADEAGWVPHAQNAKAALEARQATGRDTFERDDEPFPSTPAPGYATAPAAPVAPAPTPAYVAAPAAPQAPAAPVAPPAPAAPAAAAQSSFFSQARA